MFDRNGRRVGSGQYLKNVDLNVVRWVVELTKAAEQGSNNGRHTAQKLNEALRVDVRYKVAKGQGHMLAYAL
jgi:hypothetical protein